MVHTFPGGLGLGNVYHGGHFNRSPQRMAVMLPNINLTVRQVRDRYEMRPDMGLSLALPRCNSTSAIGGYAAVRNQFSSSER